MGFIDIKIKADSLGKSLDDIEDSVAQALQVALDSVTQMAYAQGKEFIQQRLNETRQQYLNGFLWDKISDNAYVIWLDDRVSFLEDGYPRFDMKPGLLNGPHAKISAKGTRYNTVPFFHRPYSKAPTSSAALEAREALKGVIKKYQLKQVFKDAEGKPKQGVVARVTGKNMIDNIKGVVKIQKTYNPEAEKPRTQSYYMTFRRVSEKTAPDKWWHPRWEGAHIFPDLEAWTDKKLEEILNEILS